MTCGRCFGRAGAILSVALLLAGCGTTAPATPGTWGTTATSVPTVAVGTTTAASTPGPSATSTSVSGLAPSSGGAARPPFVTTTTWVLGSRGRSLHVVPTRAGRAAQGDGDADEAWSEVVRLAPDADQPGMRAQFDCHWTYARLVQPDKPSWNLEPWRPVVTAQQMVDTRCNPGGPEAADG